MINILSYNILASVNEYNNFSDCHLPYEVRIGKIIQEILHAVEYDAIICLQEVDEKAFTILEDFLTLNDYGMVCCEYGMHGNLIAYPSNIYQLKSNKAVHIGSLAKLPASKSKKNKANFCTFIKDGKELLVVNYHFPLSIRNREIQKEHCKIIGELTNKISPVILCVDLNGSTHSKYAKILGSFRLQNTRMNTSYQHLPTVFSKNPKGRSFKGCLDHVFIRGLNVDSFYHRVPDESMPNALEGSDHVPLYCTLYI